MDRPAAAVPRAVEDILVAEVVATSEEAVVVTPAVAVVIPEEEAMAAIDKVRDVATCR